MMISKLIIIPYVILIVFLPLFLIESSAAEITATPAITFKVEYDDNINFDSKDEIDDFSGSAIPGLKLNYLTELLEFNIYGELDVKRYLDKTDFDRTNQLYRFNSKYKMLERLNLLGEFEYRKDETIVVLA